MCFDNERMKVAWTLSTWRCLILYVASCCLGQAQPIVYEATGTKEQIQPVIDQFEHDIVYGPSGSVQNPGSQLGSYKVATMDDVSSGSIGVDVNPLPSGGLDIIAGPGMTVYVSASASAFSPPNDLTVRSAAMNRAGDIIVAEPTGSPSEFVPANGFGAVFANVSGATPANLSVAGISYNVPLTMGPGTFSFVGVLQQGSGFIGDLIEMEALAKPFTGPPTSDLAVVDDLILGHTFNVPEPPTMALFTLGIVSGTIYLRWSCRRLG